MPLDLNFLNHIINVHWGGGIYVVGSQWFGTNPASVVWTKEADQTDWKKTISTPASSGGFMSSRFPGGAVCGSREANTDQAEARQPVFVIGGQADKPDVRAGGEAMLMTSEDGLTWAPQTLASHGEVYLLTWNEQEQALYAGLWDYSQLADPESDEELFDIALRSTDGLHWSEVGRTSDTSSARISPVEQYCSDKVKDIHDHKVPTSVFGYDETGDVLISPFPVNMTFGQSYPSGVDISHGTQLKIIRGSRNDNPGSGTRALPTGMARCWVVAYAAGIWQAAGETGDAVARGIVATSADDGASWEITLTDVAGSSFMNAAAGE